MFEPPDAFGMSVISEWQSHRTAKIHGLLSPDVVRDPSSAVPLDYAVAHHMLEGAEAAARGSDSDAFTWYRANAVNVTAKLSTQTAAGPAVVVAADMNGLTKSPISETPYLLLGPDTTQPSTELLTLARQAFACGEQTGFGPLLRGHAAVVTLLREKPLGATLDSWTMTRLPGTIFADHVGDATILARDLIHEAGHNWLNDALSALEIKIDSDVAFHSPWKDTHRPAFGFIHACWAFPLTMIYASAMLPQLTGAVRDYLSAWLREQTALLGATAPDHENALSVLPNVDLCDRLRLVYRTASAIQP
jgi:HEXXH motif-containing protein